MVPQVQLEKEVEVPQVQLVDRTVKVPQMQLEMFCVGPHCRSGIMVRLTATKGAVVMRLQRDDTLITAMLRNYGQC